MPSLGISPASDYSLEMIQKLLKQYGYEVDSSKGNDSHIQAVLRAFQMHFTPSHVTKKPNIETYSALLSLLEKKNKKG